MVDVKTEWGTYEDCVIQVNKYQADDSMCVSLFNAEEGPIARITTCLNDKSLIGSEGYVDTNNCPWAEQLIAEYNLGEFTGEYGISGYCSYPLYRFNLDEIKKHMEEE